MRSRLALLLVFVWASLAFGASGHGPVTLAWDAVTQDTNGNATTIAFYNVRWGTVSGQESTGTSAGNVTQFTIQGLDVSQLWYFVVTAVDDQGRESANSNEVSSRPALQPHQ